MYLKLLYLYIFLLFGLLCNLTYATTTESAGLSINLISFDNNTGNLYSTITVNLPTNSVNSLGVTKDNYLLTEKYTVDYGSLEIKKNTLVAGFNNTLKLVDTVSDANQYLYPFDIHTTKMKLYLFKTTSNIDFTTIPLNIDCSDCMFNGFDISIQDISDPDLSHEMIFTIQRTMPHKIFSIFINAIMASVAIFAFLVSIKAWKSKSAPSSNLFSFFGGLLFALPAVRGLQPEVPPLGILIDYYGFFVAEFLTAIGLLIILLAWLIKPLPHYD